MRVKTKDYGERRYWDEKYQKEETFEWFESYKTLKPVLEKHLSRSDYILMPGCGNSTLGPDMYSDGYERIDNFDFSPIVVEQMRSKYPEVRWFVTDMRSMDIPDCTYDMIVDKGGLDALTTLEDYEDAYNKALKEYIRVLKPGGKAFIISFWQAEDIISYYKTEDRTWIFDGFELLPREIAPHSYYHMYMVHRASE